MAKKSNVEEASEPVDANARLVTSADERAKAKKWFTRARELGDKRQFDHAIEYYVSGLEFWPDAEEDACKPLHGCAVARKQTGGKKPGLKDTMKRSVNDKNPRQALVNAFWLFAHDPDNVNYTEALVRNAGKLRAEDAAKWSAGVHFKLLESNSKSSAKQFQTLAQLMEELGDRAAARGETPFGVAAYQAGVDAIQTWRRRFPNDQAAEKSLRSLSTKLTILKGKYEKGESYRDSIVDAKEQADLHDQQRTVQSDERFEELIQKADDAYRAKPEVSANLKQLVDLLCRRELPEDETRAIGLLVQEYKRSGEYRWKLQADDIRMKQLGRDTREAQKTGDAEAVKERRIAQLRYELNVYKERFERYPTDNRIRFELAVRRFDAGQVDEAIPHFQAARIDPKNRAACGLYLGRCFYRKNYHSQAMSALTEALKEHEFPDDELGKSMLYWLGRSQEAGKEFEAARKSYGDVLQLDYNYKDVRARLDALSPHGSRGPAGAESN